MLACEEDRENNRNTKRIYYTALKEINRTLEEMPEYLEFLASPSIALSEKLSALESAFSESLPEKVLSYVQLMCEKGRIRCFKESFQHYAALFEASERVLGVRVISAIELTDTEKKTLTEKLEKKYECSVNSEYLIDRSLIGGLIVEVEGKVMDGSIRHHLNSVKEVIGT